MSYGWRRYEFDARLRETMVNRLANHPRTVVEEPSLRRSAVALVVCPGEFGEASYLITRRSLQLKRNAGQWALPGGRMDDGESAEQTALRELREEVGVELAPEHRIGILDDMPARSGFAITPVVFWAPGPLSPRPNPAEVQFAWMQPLGEIDQDYVPKENQVPVRHFWMNPPTAAIVYQFREVVLRGRMTRVAHIRQPEFTAH